MSGRHLFKKAQSSLELVVALIAVFVLLLGSVKIFIWLNGRMALRQQAYEAGRQPAASDNPGVQVDESDHPLLNVFGDTNWVFATPTNDWPFGVPPDEEIPLLGTSVDEDHFILGHNAKYFKFVIGGHNPQCKTYVQILGYGGIVDQEGNNIPRGQTDMLVKKGSPPTMEDYALAQKSSPSGVENLFYNFNTCPTTPEAVEISEPVEEDTFYIMLYNPTECIDVQSLRISYACLASGGNL